MAKILDNPNGGRRMIRLSGEDILMVVSLVQQEFRGSTATYTDLKDVLTTRPFYLPEEAV
jgi:hypothetical protein